MTIVVLHAYCKYLCTYKCKACNTVARGGTIRVDFQGETPEELKEFLETQPPAPSKMPIGWASYHDGFLCEKCIRRS